MKQKALRRLKPVSYRQVNIKDAFWTPRMEINRCVTLPIEYRHLKKTGHIDAWTWMPGTPKPPHHFWDSDLAKWIEAAAYSLAGGRDAALEKKIDAVISKMASAQAKDGYLNSFYLFVKKGERWTNLRDMHELYCIGHLIEAAVAYYQATGKRRLLDVITRAVDHVDRIFGNGKGQKRGYPGHQEIELALVKLYRVTGNDRYLRLSKYFLDERGKSPLYYEKEAHQRGDTGPYRYDVIQAHASVRDQVEAEGHAVRACYMYAGMTDVAAETGDKGLLAACRKAWHNITQKRMYVIGGVGSSRFSERFTFDYDLPNEDAYAETCANIALVFFAHRMLQVERDGCYADIMERALYNGVLSGVSLDGKTFFYDNLLAVHPEYYRFSGQKGPARQPWFGCACCPPNIARLLASLGDYVYSSADQEVWVHLYAGGKTEIHTAGTRIVLEQSGGYPWKERVRIKVSPDVAAPFTLALRIPQWCRKARVVINGRNTSLAAITKKGYAMIRRTWRKGDRVELVLPMPVERIEAHPRVRQDAGRIALQRGPVVYCLEEIDNGKDLADIVIPKNTRLKAEFKSKLLGGVVAVTGKARRRNQSDWKDRLYRPVKSTPSTVLFQAIPYYAWANRGTGEMITWIRHAD